LLVLVTWVLVRGGHPTRPHLSAGPGTTATTTPPKPERARPSGTQIALGVAHSARMTAPLQDAAATQIGRAHVLLAGGLTASNTSSDAVTVVGPNGGHLLGRLPSALHDAAAVELGSAAYLFGGGNGTSQLDQILRIDRTGRATVAGRLPAPSSDQAAAVLGGTAYVVGGFTGSRWLDTIVAWRPGRPAPIVAHLPTPVRYAATTAAAGRLVIVGGSLPSGTASRAVLGFDPRSGRVHRIASLPAPTTHAAAAAIGRTVFVIGGRGSAPDTPSDRIVAVDLPSGRVRSAGLLPTPLSDLAAVTLGRRVLVAGGRGHRGTVASLTELAPRAIRPAAATPTGVHTHRAVDVYGADRAGHLTGAARYARPLVYVPNSQSNTVDAIDPRTLRVVEHFDVGVLPQHVVPSWDLRTLYVTNDLGNSLTVIDPRTGRPGRTIPVEDPYNMYFTPDGRYAIVVAERLARLDFRDAHTFRLHRSLPVACRGVDHVDFSADGAYLLASCEFSSQLVKVDVARERVLGTLDLPGNASPQDVKLSPDGRVFYVADLVAGGVWEIDGDRLRILGFIRTGAGAHGLYVSRDDRNLYVTNRSAGSISVISFNRRRIVATWRIPGGSPDMGNVSADGKVLWLSGRYNAEVYAISTLDGRLLARIRVGRGPHGLCVWPQPGRYSLGHTGILR
jgi:DNA-binding beta-propeller fold protein YncE